MTAIRNVLGQDMPVTNDGGAELVQSVHRALSILETLAALGEGGVAEIARDLDVHRSTAFRLISTLESHGLVEQVADRGRYRLGIGVLRLAGATTARLDVVQEARSICRRLASVSGETVNLAVLADGSALYLDQVTGTSAYLQTHNWVGQHIPLHATSNGKALLTGLDRAGFDRTIGKMPAYTERTITRRASLWAEVQVARDRGYAIAVDELEPGLTAIATPIHNAQGSVIASMSVSGPTFRFPPARVEALTAQVVDAGCEVSQRLGWHAPRVGTGTASAGGSQAER